MCSSNYSAENTPHSFGPVLAIELSICGRWKRRETGKGNHLPDLGARFLFFLLELLLLWVKLERTTSLTGFGLEEGTLGRAKEKQSGFTAIGGREQPLIPSFISCHKLHSLHSLVGVCVCVCFSILGFFNTVVINYIYTYLLSMSL